MYILQCACHFLWSIQNWQLPLCCAIYEPPKDIYSMWVLWKDSNYADTLIVFDGQNDFLHSKFLRHGANIVFFLVLIISDNI